MNSRVHPKYKTKYRVKNWASYDRTLVRRGDVTVWLSPEVIAAWKPASGGRRGGQWKYSDAIETTLTPDLIQSTCREVLEQEGVFRYGGEAGFRHWLYATALRKILDKHERHTAQKRDVGREEGAANAAELLEAYRRFASPSAAAIGREELAHIEAAFAALPDDYREVVLLSRVVGLARADVAREMGRSEASVRNLLHRALLRLAELLDTGSA